MPIGTGRLYYRSGRQSRCDSGTSGERGKDLSDGCMTLSSVYPRCAGFPTIISGTWGRGKSEPVHSGGHRMVCPMLSACDSPALSASLQASEFCLLHVLG